MGAHEITESTNRNKNEKPPPTELSKLSQIQVGSTGLV